MQQPPDGDGRNANDFSVFLPAACSPAGLTKGQSCVDVIEIFIPLLASFALESLAAGV